MTDETGSEGFLIAAEVAGWLRVRRSTIYSWAATGQIPSVRLNGIIRFIRADIESWIKDHSKDLADPNPPMFRPIVFSPKTTISHQTLQRIGERAVRRSLGMQPSRRNSNEPSRPIIATRQRKDQR